MATLTAEQWEKFEAFCERLATSEDSMVKICGEEGMPHVNTILRWIAQDDPQGPVRTAYATARQSKAEYLADQMLEIADDSSEDYTEREYKNGRKEVSFNPEAVRRAEVRIKTRQWLASKYDAERYGDRQKVDLTHSTADLNDEQLMKRLAEMAKTLGMALPANLLRKPDDDDDA